MSDEVNGVITLHPNDDLEEAMYAALNKDYFAGKLNARNSHWLIAHYGGYSYQCDFVRQFIRNQDYWAIDHIKQIGPLPAE